MGFGGISIWQLLILLVIVVMVFGTKRLRNMGGDLGTAIKGFRSSMRDGNDADKDKDKDQDEEHGDPEVIENRSAEDDGSAKREPETGKETSKETGS